MVMFFNRRKCGHLSCFRGCHCFCFSFPHLQDQRVPGGTVPTLHPPSPVSGLSWVGVSQTKRGRKVPGKGARMCALKKGHVPTVMFFNKSKSNQKAKAFWEVFSGVWVKYLVSSSFHLVLLDEWHGRSCCIFSGINDRIKRKSWDLILIIYALHVNKIRFLWYWN